MFKEILYTQWKWSRIVVLAGTLLAFAIPVLSVRTAGQGNLQHWEAEMLLNNIDSWGVLYPILAAALALLFATTAWAPDHRGRHVYALSLPLPRWHYALLRFSAGATLLAAPVVAVWTGALLATAAATIPPGLHPYPAAIAVRFALALFVAYAIFFAASAATTRTAAYILGAICLLIVAQVMLGVAHVETDLLGGTITHILNWPGPLDVFTGRWMLIDV